MATTPQRPAGTIGVVRIVRQAREGDRVRPFDGLISFGGSKAPNGALYLGKAFGIIADHYAISGVTLRKGQLHRLTK